jgi:hypothetical protein
MIMAARMIRRDSSIYLSLVAPSSRVREARGLECRCETRRGEFRALAAVAFLPRSRGRIGFNFGVAREGLSFPRFGRGGENRAQRSVQREGPCMSVQASLVNVC